MSRKKLTERQKVERELFRKIPTKKFWREIMADGWGGHYYVGKTLEAIRAVLAEYDER